MSKKELFPHSKPITISLARITLTKGSKNWRLVRYGWCIDNNFDLRSTFAFTKRTYLAPVTKLHKCPRLLRYPHPSNIAISQISRTYLISPPFWYLLSGTTFSHTEIKDIHWKIKSKWTILHILNKWFHMLFPHQIYEMDALTELFHNMLSRIWEGEQDTSQHTKSKACRLFQKSTYLNNIITILILCQHANRSQNFFHHFTLCNCITAVFQYSLPDEEFFSK